MNALIAKLKNWYSGLQDRERRVVTIGAAALGLLIIVGGILLPLQSAVSAAVRRAESRRECALESVATVLQKAQRSFERGGAARVR